MNIEKSARELLAHDGIFAVAISPSSEQTVAVAEDGKPEMPCTEKLKSLCSNSIGIHRRVGIAGMSRLVINEAPFGSISVVTNTVDGMMVAVIVRSGHNVCKSLQRMVKRAITRAKKGTTLRMPTASAQAVV